MLSKPTAKGVFAKLFLEYTKAAISDFNETIHLDPDYARAYYGRGFAKNLLGHAKEGNQDIQSALDLSEKAGDEELKSAILKAYKSYKTP